MSETTYAPPESVEQIIELLKDGEYEFYVNLGGENEDPMTGINLNGNYPLPEDDAHKEFEETFSDLAVELKQIQRDYEGAELAQRFGAVAIEYIEEIPELQVEVIPDIVSNMAVTEEDVIKCITVASVYPEIDDMPSPSDMTVDVIVGLCEQYGGDVADKILSTIIHGKDNGMYTSQAVYDAWRSLDDMSVESVAETAIENGVDDVRNAVITIYSLEQYELSQDDWKEINKLETYSEAISEEDTQTSAEENHGGESDDNDTEQPSLIEQQFSTVPDDVSDEERDALIQDVFDEINESDEFVGIDKYWVIGTVANEVNDRFGVNYSTINSEFDTGISSSYNMQARKLAEMYDYKEYPEEITLSGFYGVTTKSESDEKARKRLDALGEEGLGLKKTQTDMWTEHDFESIEEIVSVVGDERRNPTIEDVKILSVLTDSDALVENDVEAIVKEHEAEIDISGEETESEVENESLGEITGFSGSGDEGNGEDDEAEVTEETTEEVENTGSEQEDEEEEEVEEVSEEEAVVEADASEGRISNEEPVDVFTYTDALTSDSEITVDRDSGTVRAIDSEYRKTLEVLFSPSIPTEQLVSTILEYDDSVAGGIVPVSTGNRFWVSVLDEIGVLGDTVIDPRKVTDSVTSEDMTANRASDEWHVSGEKAQGFYDETSVTYTDPYTPFVNGDVRSDDTLFIVEPTESSEAVALSIMAYAANGGKNVLYLGERKPGSADNPVVETLEREFTLQAVYENLSWESNTDALYVYETEDTENNRRENGLERKENTVNRLLQEGE